MSQRKWLGAFIVVALSASSAAFAIENGAGDRDTSRGSNWEANDRTPEQARGGYYQDNEMRARHQRSRDDDAERRWSRDFDVQGKMNN